MARERNNPTKLRAQRRAKELGKTIGQVYAEAKVNKAYLSEVPANGWRADKLQAIARALNWTIDELVVTAEQERAETEGQGDDLMQMAVEAAVDVCRVYFGPGNTPPPFMGQLIRILHDMLRQQLSSGEPQLTLQVLGMFGREFVKLLRASAKA